MRVLCLAAVAWIAALGAAVPAPSAAQAPPDWPTETSTTRPWTRWWWQGSAVDEAGLTAALEAFRDAGLGGVDVRVHGVEGAPVLALRDVTDLRIALSAPIGDIERDSVDEEVF